jgi:hypothetical protein
MDDGIELTFDGGEPAIATAEMLFLDVPAFLFIKRDEVGDLIGQAGIDAEINDHAEGPVWVGSHNLSTAGAGRH